MSAHHADRIYKPSFFGIRHLNQGRGARRPYIVGFDSEAHSCELTGHPECDENGHPFLYQFAYPDGTCDLIDVPYTSRRYETFFVFVRHLWDICRRKDAEYLVYGYNLQYEYTQLFRDLDDEVKAAGEFRLGDKPNEPCILPLDNIPFYVSAFNQKRYSFTIEWAHTKRRVRVLDAMAFLPGGLDNASKMIGAGRKENKPASFDRGAIQDADFIRYASQDAILTQRLGEWITELHETYDVSQTVSAPHFASKVYKRGFLRDEIKPVSVEIEQDGLRSYHGGKNGFYLSRPSLLRDVWHVDIRSAYPEAMRQLPDPERAEWVFTDRYQRGGHALWRVRGKYRCCRYRGLMSDDAWARSGMVDLVTTGYELDACVARGEIDIDSCEGWIMDGPDGGSLADYVDVFYRLKSSAATTTEKVAAKLFLNSLYGKFFQKIAQGTVGTVELDSGRMIWTNPAQEHDWVAGGLYHPPIASLITGFVRARIHGLEHDLGSVMTSTDGVFSRDAPPAHMLGRGLGMLSAERGTLALYRERVYIFDPDTSEHEDSCPVDCHDPHPRWASHGITATLGDLRAMPLAAGRRLTYTSRARPVLLRESTHLVGGRRRRPGEFVRTERGFHLPGGKKPVDTVPALWDDA